MAVASIPMWSARVRLLIPRPSFKPRQKLPPPTTMPTCTPSPAQRATTSHTLSMTSKSKPRPASPPSASPLTFNSTRLYFNSSMAHTLSRFKFTAHLYLSNIILENTPFA